MSGHLRAAPLHLFFGGPLSRCNKLYLPRYFPNISADRLLHTNPETVMRRGNVF
jgi:hypothetical protein